MPHGGCSRQRVRGTKRKLLATCAFEDTAKLGITTKKRRKALHSTVDVLKKSATQPRSGTPVQSQQCDVSSSRKTKKKKRKRKRCHCDKVNTVGFAESSGNSVKEEVASVAAGKMSKSVKRRSAVKKTAKLVENIVPEVVTKAAKKARRRARRRAAMKDPALLVATSATRRAERRATVKEVVPMVVTKAARRAKRRAAVKVFSNGDTKSNSVKRQRVAFDLASTQVVKYRKQMSVSALLWNGIPASAGCRPRDDHAESAQLPRKSALRRLNLR